MSGETATLNNWYSPEHDCKKLLICYAIILIPAQMGGKLTYSLERGITW